MKRTPWGKVISVTEVAEGIEIVRAERGGERCGGIHLSPKRRRQIDRLFKFHPSAPGNWFEWQSEWIVPVLVFRSEFTEDYLIERAVSGMECHDDDERYDDVRAWWNRQLVVA